MSNLEDVATETWSKQQKLRPECSRLRPEREYFSAGNSKMNGNLRKWLDKSPTLQNSKFDYFAIFFFLPPRTGSIPKYVLPKHIGALPNPGDRTVQVAKSRNRDRDLQKRDTRHVSRPGPRLEISSLSRLLRLPLSLLDQVHAKANTPKPSG